MYKSDTDEFIRIAYPQEALKQQRKYLDDYYISMYGENYRDLIKSRTNKTLYMLDSNPVETFLYLKENIDNVFDWEHFEKMEIYYKDFLALKEKYEQETNEKIYQLFCYYNNLNPSFYKAKKEEIILNISSYASYKELCDSLSIAPINSQDYTNFLKRRKILKDREKNDIVKNSIWLKDITIKGCKVPIAEETLCSIFSLNSSATARCYNFGALTIVYCPIIEIYRKGLNSDTVFLHENRHAIEAGENRYIVGIHNPITDLYLLNEIRTERHAIEDDKNIPTIFSKRKESDLESLYKNFIPFTNLLFTYYKSLFDTCAIENNIEKLSGVFNESDLIALEQLYRKTFQKILDFQLSSEKELTIDYSSHSKLESVLVKQAYNNGFKPYQS